MKLATWSALALELSAPFLIYILPIRFMTFLAVVSLHVGMDLSMQMHTFQPLVILGWVPFLIQRDRSSASKTYTAPMLGKLLQVLAFLYLAGMITSQTIPYYRYHRLVDLYVRPHISYSQRLRLKHSINRLALWNDKLQQSIIPISSAIGMSQGAWN